ncbi:MAG TPA: SHOCT domain-containing protein [Acidimicrobiia bacterium]|nr:SHOCT domain-containing protein [Acidimicrobiia bacterium]
MAQVRELADLHRSGVLTDDEFSAAKAKMLDLDDDVK